MSKPDGQRWVRGYRPNGRDEQRYALWEQQGGKPKRVGTARARREVAAFLGLPNHRHTWVTVRLPILTRLPPEQVTRGAADAAVAALRRRLADHLDVDGEDLEVVGVDLGEAAIEGEPR